MPVWSDIDDQEQVLKMKFGRQEVQAYLETLELSDTGEVELLVSGELTDGTLFTGTDFVKIIQPGKK